MEPLTLKHLDVEANYPKSYIELTSYMIMTIEQAGVDKNVNIKQLVDLSLEFSPRYLYDFFDSKQILVTVYADDLSDFSYGILKKGSSHDGSNFKSRIETEKKAFQTAFDILEKSL